MPFDVSGARKWVSQYKKIWNEVESQVFEKLTAEPIKGKYIHSKLKMLKECIKTNFNGKDVPYDIYCNATAVLKIDSVYKQSKNIILRYMLKSVNTPMHKTDNVTC